MSNSFQGENGAFADQMARERERSEELVSRLNKVNKEIAESTQRENELRSGIGKKDKEIALIRHDLKELQRKVELETDLRKKAEGERSDMKRRMEDEINKRTREQNNSHMVSEKISSLEKEKRELAEKGKKDQEYIEKMKKVNTELSVAKAASESALSDLNDKLQALSEDRNILERELAKQQFQLQVERDQRNEASSHSQELDLRISSLVSEVRSFKDLNQGLERENAELNSRISDLEKSRANLEVDLKNTQSKIKHLTDERNQNSRSSSNDHLGNVVNKKAVFEERLKNLEGQLSDEKLSRSRLESTLSDREREISMLTVDCRKVQFKLDKAECELRTETEKFRQSSLTLNRLKEEKADLQSQLSSKASEVTLLQSNENRLIRDLAEQRERAKSFEEELHKVKAARSVEDLQRKDLEDQLETAEHFSGLYKTQVRELEEEVEEERKFRAQLDKDKEVLARKYESLRDQLEAAELDKKVLADDFGELEREKMMIALELDNQGSKFRADSRNLEIQLAAAKDNESDLLQRIDLLSKEQDEYLQRIQVQQEEMEELKATKPPPNAEDSVKLKKLLENEKILKQQAVNKLAEVMNRKDFNVGKRSKKEEQKAVSQEVRKKDKEIRKLQQDLRSEKQNLNEVVAKFEQRIQDLQVTIFEESQIRNKIQMELDTKESELEQVQMKLQQLNMDTASLSSGMGGEFESGAPSSMDVVSMEITAPSPPLEGWLQVPSKHNIRRHGWKKIFVVVSSKKIIFFNSEADRQNTDPALILDLK